MRSSETNKFGPQSWLCHFFPSRHGETDDLGPFPERDHKEGQWPHDGQDLNLSSGWHGTSVGGFPWVCLNTVFSMLYGSVPACGRLSQ